MRTLIMACRTVENELRMAMAQAGVDYPVLYLDAGLHLWPDRLREAIQRDLDRIENVDVVLMGYGFCGESLVGVKSDRFKIVVPRVHDCISLLLGSTLAREQCGNDVYFFTKGWLDHEISIAHEYNRCVARYGEQKATSIMKKMMKHHKGLTAIDTGAYNVEPVKLQVQTLAEKMGWKFETVPGSLRIFHKLLKGPWDEEFVVLEPGQVITLDDMVKRPPAQ
jgi:hypothetical protein